MIRVRPQQGLEPEWYTPPQPDDGAPARFLLRPLTTPQLSEAEQEITTTRRRGRMEFRVTARGIEILWEAGVAKMENVVGASDEPIKSLSEALDWLPPQIVQHVVWQVFLRSKLTEVEKKSSSAPSRSPAIPSASPAAGPGAAGARTE